jgi:hypothetical protein
VYRKRHLAQQKENKTIKIARICVDIQNQWSTLGTGLLEKSTELTKQSVVQEPEKTQIMGWVVSDKVGQSTIFYVKVVS